MPPNLKLLNGRGLIIFCCGSNLSKLSMQYFNFVELDWNRRVMVLLNFMICLLLIFAIVAIGRVSGQINTRRCIGPNKEYGFCTHVSRCPLPEFKQDRLRFMDYFCIIDRLYVGVCCPDKFLFQSQIGTTLVGNHFPIGNDNNNFENSIGPSIELTPVVTDGAGSNPPVRPKPVSPPSVQPKPTAAPSSQRTGCGLNEKMDVGRVIGGKPADPKEWPWMVALMRDDDVQFCGGCLVTERHILTAAHCVHGTKPSSTYVRLGEHDFTRIDETRTQTVNVTEIRSHINFDQSTYENDIAILKLSRAVTFNSYVWPVCLPELQNLFVDKTAVVIGWGTIEYGGPVSDKLLEVAVPVWKNSDCAEHYVQTIEDNHICAGGQEGKDSCKGDSGGPLMIQLENRRWVTIGIVSWGIKCGEDRPAVYTRVNRYLDWIVRNTL